MGNQSKIDKLIKKITPVVVVIMAIGGGVHYFSLKIDFEYKILSTIQNIVGSFAFNPDLKIKDINGK